MPTPTDPTETPLAKLLAAHAQRLESLDSPWHDDTLTRVTDSYERVGTNRWRFESHDLKSGKLLVWAMFNDAGEIIEWRGPAELNPPAPDVGQLPTETGAYYWRRAADEPCIFVFIGMRGYDLTFYIPATTQQGLLTDFPKGGEFGERIPDNETLQELWRLAEILRRCRGAVPIRWGEQTKTYRAGKVDLPDAMPEYIAEAFAAIHEGGLAQEKPDE